MADPRHELDQGVVTESTFSDYVQDIAGHEVYLAARQGYTRNFPRDAFAAGIIAAHRRTLYSQLVFSAEHQATSPDPQTGAMPGRIHHEYPGVVLEGSEVATTYSAAETTALFLIAAEGLIHLDRDSGHGFVREHYEALGRAALYTHDSVTEDGIAEERLPAGGRRHGTLVTIWKDSILPGPEGKTTPVYPVAYAQLQFIAARGLLSASRLLNRPEWAVLADKMFRVGIDTFIRPDGFTVYRDRDTVFDMSSSDEMHSLAYVPGPYRDQLPLNAVRQRASELATPFGYMCTPYDIAMRLPDQYHGAKVWPYDQAMIHAGAEKFGMEREAKTAASIAPYVGSGQELFAVVRDGPIWRLYRKGNPDQLFARATVPYFAGKVALRMSQWL